MDDNGNTFLCSDDLEEAEAAVYIMTMKGHKQVYICLSYMPETRAEIISKYHIIE
jgi:hypothetical protein